MCDVRDGMATKYGERKPWAHLYNTAAWKAIRKQQLSDHPLCTMCEQSGYITAANVCDHITPHKGDETLFYSGPFQSLCKLHHDSSKKREEYKGHEIGGDVSGRPHDPNHHWNR